MNKVLPRLIISLLILVLLSWLAQATREGPVDRDKPLLEVTFLDVGQGDATFIRTPGGRIILIDGGPKEVPSYLVSSLQKRLTPKREKGLKGLWAGFWGLSPGKIDTLVLTHPHSDHVGGLSQVLEKYEVREILDPSLPHTTSTYKKFLRLVEEKDIPYHRVSRGMRLNWDPLLKIVVLNPPRKRYQGTPADLNNNSVVIKLTYNKVSFLLTADIETLAEGHLTRHGERLHSTILKVPHQGSHTSSTPGFINLVRPEWAVISVGKDNKYGHPHQEVIERYKKIGSKVYRTDSYNTTTLVEGKLRTTHNGTITFLTDGEHYEIKTEKELEKVQAELEEAKPSFPPYKFPEISREELAKEVPQEEIDVLPLIDEDYFKRVHSTLRKAGESIYMVMFIVSPGKGENNPVNILLQDLIAARKRGVRVKVILERSKRAKGFVAKANRGAYYLLSQEGLDVKFDNPKFKTHDKFLVVDRKVVIIGNHNWTKDALDGTQNEASVLIKSKALAQEYLRYFYENEW